MEENELVLYDWINLATAWDADVNTRAQPDNLIGNLVSHIRVN